MIKVADDLLGKSSIKTTADMRKNIEVSIAYWENEIKSWPHDEEITVQARAKLLVLRDVLELIDSFEAGMRDFPHAKNLGKTDYKKFWRCLQGHPHGLGEGD